MGEDVNRRTAEQETAEYRSENIAFVLLTLLLFEIPCSIFDIQNIKEVEFHFKQLCKFDSL